jgi:hypothetical protein
MLSIILAEQNVLEVLAFGVLSEWIRTISLKERLFRSIQYKSNKINNYILVNFSLNLYSQLSVTPYSGIIRYNIVVLTMGNVVSPRWRLDFFRECKFNLICLREVSVRVVEGLIVGYRSGS